MVRASLPLSRKAMTRDEVKRWLRWRLRWRSRGGCQYCKKSGTIGSDAKGASGGGLGVRAVVAEGGDYTRRPVGYRVKQAS